MPLKKNEKNERNEKSTNQVSDRQAAFERAKAEVEKRFGDRAIQRLGDASSLKVDVISTQSLGIDIATGVGGVPRGRITEIYGPESSGKTLFCLHVIAEAQKQGGTCVLIDAENAFDVEQARSIGVDVENLHVSQPESGEAALEIAQTMIASGSIDVLVVDSAAALVSRAEIEGDMGDSHVGLQARLMSQAMRKLSSPIKATNTAVIFTNQLREKVGVMFGCLHGDTLVNFVDGRSLPIRKVVDEKITGQVWSFNEKSNQFEAAEIIDWHYNGDVSAPEDYIHIETTSIDGKGRFGVTVTPDHEIMTDGGWCKAKDIAIGSKVLSKYTSTFNETLLDFLAGVFVGDSTIGVRSKNTASLKLQDSINKEYVNWKIKKLNACGLNFKQNGKRFDSDYTYELALIKKQIQNRDPMFLLNNFSPLGFALWMMDDSYYSSTKKRYVLSIKRLKFSDAIYDIAEKLNNILGTNGAVSITDGAIIFDKASTEPIAKMICRYVPDCMQYKLPEEYQGMYQDFSLRHHEEIKTSLVEVVSIRNASDRQMRQKGKYDLTVENNHNYLAGGNKNGILLHNSPETTPGGRALKFYASVRLDIRRIETLKDGDEVIGIKSRVKVSKNKVAAPFRETEVDIMFSPEYKRGFSLSGEVLDFGVKDEFIRKAGAFYSYGDVKLGQGRENVKKFLEKNPELLEQIRQEIMKKHISTFITSGS